ncbi:tRNA pseudouridine(55) synthase TruB [Candidatus Saccharibacteria bacterium]|nr:tRNA pseudouridine(55) synthase TruB [Candidatus Saccharibacteria bacterium]
MEDRIILVDKPAGISSFGVVAKVRGALRAEFGHKIKVGHTGTLDPFATGLLILLSGKMTKKSTEFLKLDKWYEATMRLGYISTTGDPEGEIREFLGENVEGVKAVSLAEAELVVAGFVGKIWQTPPRYSAIKINGQRAYRLARKGVEFEVPKREVEIYAIEILRYEWPELLVRCHVSSGTYIRTLAEDIGAALGTGAYLTTLRRLKIGEYDVKDAVRLEELVPKRQV